MNVQKQAYESINEDVTIKFDSQITKTMKLIEIPPDLLKLIETGESLEIKGNETEEAVLCTKKQTYALKRVETSNDVFLIHPSENKEFTIQASCRDYYEIKPSKGKVDKIDSLIKEYLANPSQYVDIKKYIYKHILASDEEINQAMIIYGIIEIDQQYKIITKEIKLLYIKEILQLILLHQWDINALDITLFEQALASFDPLILKYLFGHIGTMLSDNKVQLTMQRVASLSAELILWRHLRINKEEFLIEFCSQTPTITSITTIDPKILEGIAIHITDDDQLPQGQLANAFALPQRPYYHYLPADQMTIDLSKRLESLFQIKTSFTCQEMIPYFIQLIPQESKIEEFLVTHCKYIDGKYYSK